MSTPTVGDQGTLSGLHIAFVIIGGTIGMAVFLVSAQIGGALGLKKAGLAFVMGCQILAVFGSLTSYVGARTRRTTYQLCETAFGGDGAKLVNSLIALSLLGWFAVIANTMGALSEFVFSTLYGWTFPPAVYVIVSSLAIVGVTASGFRGIDRVALWMTPAMLVLLIHAAFTCIDSVPSWELPLAHVPPMSFASAISAVVGSYIAGVIIQPDYSRHACTCAHAVTAAFIALGISFPLVMFLAAIPGQALEQVDLRGLMLAMGLGLPAFTLLFLGAWSSNVLCLYSSSLSAATVIGRLNYRVAVVIIGTIGTCLGLVDAQSYLINFLVLLGITIPPVGAIYVVEALLLEPAKTADSSPVGNSWLSRTWVIAVGAWLGAAVFGFLVHRGLVGISGVAAIDVILFSALVFFLLNQSRWRRPGKVLAPQSD